MMKWMDGLIQVLYTKCSPLMSSASNTRGLPAPRDGSEPPLPAAVEEVELLAVVDVAAAAATAVGSSRVKARVAMPQPTLELGQK